MSDPVGILNWRRIDAQVTTSGQPSEAQLGEIAEMGVRTVINLGPYDNNGALQDEPGTVADLGMTYVYIPVDFDTPTDADYIAFRSALDATGGAPVHVHCIYNARVSAFFYKLAKDTKADMETAFDRMDGIWRPGGIWAAFIDDSNSLDLPNRFAGFEYTLETQG
mgnify:FL=1